MGKSPGKWIKTLFGKKSKSQVLKKYASEKERDDGMTSLGLASPAISQPVPVNDYVNGNPLESEIALQSGLPTGQTEALPVDEDARKQTSFVLPDADDPRRVQLENAAVKAQAAFRGYLARRAFRALRGIIRLQAVMRGHLVRRQAVATFHCIMGIVKLQAVARGFQVRLSSEVDAKSRRSIVRTAKQWDTPTVGTPSLKMKFRDRTYIFKLLSGTPIAMPLQMQYVDGEPNSAWNWLERWTLIRFWKPLPKANKAIGSKSQGKQGSFTTESESGRPKRSVRRNFSSNSDHESEKVKRNSRKYLNSQPEATQENTQIELEKVKRNLRRMANSATITSSQADVETEKPKFSSRKALNTPIDEKKEKVVKDAIALATEVNPGLENMPKPEQGINLSVAADSTVEADDSTNGGHNAAPPSTLPLQGIVLDENRSPPVEDLMPKEDQCLESHKITRRRASFSKSDYPENMVHDTPKLPSYMAATESAKAKLRGQTSPRLSSDSVDKNTVDKNGITRRHSLPTSMNGKLTSQSPRVQRIVPASVGKVGTKGDKPFSSSRDDKLIQVEWKR